MIAFQEKITASKTIVSEDNAIGMLGFECDASSEAIEITLPSAADVRGHHYFFVRTDLVLSSVTIKDTLYGDVTLNDQGDNITLYSDGTNWRAEVLNQS